MIVCITMGGARKDDNSLRLAIEGGRNLIGHFFDEGDDVRIFDFGIFSEGIEGSAIL